MKIKENSFDLLSGIDICENEKKELEILNKISDYVLIMINRRIELGMSQRELAYKTGIKQPMIARIESLTSIPRLDTFQKIIDALELKIDFFDEMYQKIEIIEEVTMVNWESNYDCNSICTKSSLFEKNSTLKRGELPC